MVVVIVVVFVLCWLPFFIINIVNLVVIIPESSVTAGIYFFAVILSYANSCANPVLYGFLSDNFRQSFRKVGFILWVLRQREGEGCRSICHFIKCANLLSCRMKRLTPL